MSLAVPFLLIALGLLACSVVMAVREVMDL